MENKSFTELQLIWTHKQSDKKEFTLKDTDLSYSCTRNNSTEGRFKREVEKQNYELRDLFNIIKNEDGTLDVKCDGHLLLTIPLTENTMLTYTGGVIPNKSVYEEIGFGFYD